LVQGGQPDGEAAHGGNLREHLEGFQKQTYNNGLVHSGTFLSS
jgi:hypothetical protein